MTNHLESMEIYDMLIDTFHKIVMNEVKLKDHRNELIGLITSLLDCGIDKDILNYEYCGRRCYYLNGRIYLNGQLRRIGAKEQKRAMANGKNVCWRCREDAEETVKYHQYKVCIPCSKEIVPRNSKTRWCCRCRKNVDKETMHKDKGIWKCQECYDTLQKARATRNCINCKNSFPKETMKKYYKLWRCQECYDRISK